MADALLQEDGSFILQEDGTSKLLLEQQPSLVTFDTAFSANTSSQFSFNLTVGPNQDRYVTVAIGDMDGPVAMNTITCGGVAGTRIGFVASATARAELWGVLAPPVGVNSVVIGGASNNGRCFVTATSYYSVNQLNPVNTSVTASGTTSPITAAVVTTVPNTLLVDSIACKNVPTKNAAQTLRGQQAGVNQFGAENQGASDKQLSAAGSGTMTWTMSSGGEWDMVVAALAPAPVHSQQTQTAQAKAFNTSKRQTAQARVKGNHAPTSTAKGRKFNKTQKGGLADLQYRCIDLMKFSKDNWQNQLSDAQQANIASAMQQYFNLTHISMGVYIDPVEWFSPSFTPGPRTLANYYVSWANAIHNTGLRILHRAESSRMQHQNNFNTSFLPQGTLAEIIPSIGAFSDSFNRANIYTSITVNNSSFTDNFNRATLGTTDWKTPVGSWSISGNEVLCSGTANATSNVLLSQAQYTDFTLQAKVKKVSLIGFSAITFRMQQSQALFSNRGYCNFFGGYVVELRDSNVLRIEDIATANLVEVTKAYTAGTYYQVKIQATGNNLKVRVWQDGTSEPGTWDIDFIDTGNRFSTGSIGFISENTSLPTIYDDLSITFSPTSNVNSDWNQISSGWQIENGTVKLPSAAAQWSNILYSKLKYSNFTYTSKVKSLSTPTGKTGVIFRGNTVNFGFGFTAYTARIQDNNSLQLEDMSLGDFVTIAKTFDPSTWYNFKVACNGNHIQVRVWKDGDSEPGTWDIDYIDVNNKYPSGSIGFAPENTTNSYYDDVVIAITPNYNSWLGMVYLFITNNPTAFMNGDIWAPFPERDADIFQGTSFLSYNSPGIQANFLTFYSDLIDVSNYAFAQIGKPGVITGFSGPNYSTPRSGYLPQSWFDKAGVTAFDYYLNYDHSLDFRGAKAKSDLDVLYTNYGKKIVWEEWGPVPDMISNVSSTQGQIINGFGSIQYPDPGYGENREAWIRDFYTNCLVAAFNEGKLIMFDYWGFWDTGENDTGLEVGSINSVSTIGLRREGQILREYYHAGTSPLRWSTAKAKVQNVKTVTSTARARAKLSFAKTSTARARVRHATPNAIVWESSNARTRGRTTWTRHSNN